MAELATARKALSVNQMLNASQAQTADAQQVTQQLGEVQAIAVFDTYLTLSKPEAVTLKTATYTTTNGTTLAAISIEGA